MKICLFLAALNAAFAILNLYFFSRDGSPLSLGVGVFNAVVAAFALSAALESD